MRDRGPKVLRDRLRLVFGLLEGDRPKRILEIGCATGYFSRVLRGLAEQVVSVDINPDFVKEARRTTRGVRFHVGPAERLAFPGKDFDTVIFLDVLEHTLDPDKAIAQIHRKMSKGGRLYLSVPQKGWFAFLDVDNLRRAFRLHWPGLYEVLYRALTGKGRDPSTVAPRHRHYSLDEIERLLGGKFRVERDYQRGLLLYPLGLVLDPLVKRVPWVGGMLHEGLNVLMDLDFRIGYGDAGYNLLVVAVKR